MWVLLNGFRLRDLMPMKTIHITKACLIAAIVSLSACATVDVTAIGDTKSDVKTVEFVETGNVITRTAKRLYQVFVAKGWYEDTSRKRVNTATNVLLNGLKDVEVDVETGSQVTYTSTDEFLNEIKTARYHLTQTTKAAEVYLDIASSDADLTGELKQLQKSLHVSEKVHENFSNQQNESALVETELNSFAVDIETLRQVTNDFGDVVRARQLASKSASAS